MNFNSATLLEALLSDLKRRDSDDEIRDIRKDAMKNALLKKYVPDHHTRTALHGAAVDDFVSFNEKLRSFKLNASFTQSSLFRTWKCVLEKAFTMGDGQTAELTMHSCLAAGMCGPGSALKANDTSFFTKMFNSPLTTTSLDLHRFYVANLPRRWAQAEVTRQALLPTQVVGGSRLDSVPKDGTKNRTISVEPVLNMFYQLGAKTVLNSILRRSVKIDVTTQQEINRFMARSGSIDGELSTLDLKNASDSITLELCEKLLPANIYSLLMRIRSADIDIGCGKYTSLAMMSTMGNGFTFSLMTLLFATLIQSVYIQLGLSFQNGVTFGVYGDDLIIKTAAVPLLLESLQDAGFVVNSDKSFTSGFFRESCGGDYYKGHDVRGVYMKECNNEAQLYSVFNRLHFWSIRHNISLHNTLVYLKGLAKFQPVPGHASVHEGFIVSRSELLCPKTSATGAIYYRSTQPVEFSRRVASRRYGGLVNPAGCLIAFLGGFIRNNQVTLRSLTDEFRVVRRCTPHWDYITYAGVHPRELSDSWAWLLSHA